MEICSVGDVITYNHIIILGEQLKTFFHVLVDNVPVLVWIHIKHVCFLFQVLKELCKIKAENGRPICNLVGSRGVRG